MTYTNLIWTRFLCLILGVWLLIAPFTFSYHSSAMEWNDAISGILLAVFALLSFNPQRLWAPWAVCLVGIWLQLAPLVFWAPHAFIYLDDTLIGVLAITFSILVPGTPGETTFTGPDIPPGWSYNPSSWTQRIPIAFFGFVGWFISRYMAAYQLGYLDDIWDPIFGSEGTLKVITSDLSKSFPISDAGLGSFAYTLEALMALKGGIRRWHSMPWIVVTFGILVVPLGIVTILLIICQPLIVGHWCSWCLLAGLCMLMMISLTVDEVAAVIQHLAKVRKEKKPFWKIFWQGGESDGAAYSTLPPLNAPLSQQFPAMVRGVSVPWNLLLTTIIGICLMVTPTLFGIVSRSVSDNHYVVGALVITCSIIGMAEVTRAVRFINIPLAIWIMTALLFLEGPSLNLIAGAALIFLSFPKGKIRDKYGSQ